MADVFISYARSTASQAQAMAGALRALGYSVWIDDDLPAHRAYSQVIEEELEQARATLVVWSSDAARSEWVMSEANRAREARKLVQVLVDQTRLPMPFDQIQYANLSGWTGDGDDPGWRKAVSSIAQLLNGGTTPLVASAEPAPGPPPEGERRHLSVLFCDIVSSTEIAAGLDPEDWHAIASQYQRMASEAVAAFGGYVSKYLGDGVIAYFGYPRAQEDAAERAVRSGLAILEAMAGLNAREARQHAVQLEVRVGVHAGTVVVAQGAGAEPDFFGDAPNIASRVQGAAEPGTLVITGAVRDLAADLFETEDLGPTPLKGAPEPVRLYRVARPHAERRRVGRRQDAPFVGREDEMRLLLGRWERVCEGQGQVVLLSGEPGIGKSRLMEEFRARTGEAPRLAIESAGAPFFTNTPFHGLVQLIGPVLARSGDDSPQARFARLEAALEGARVKTAEAAPLIADMLGLPVPSTYPPPMLGPEQVRPRLLAALAGWALGAARDQPLLIVVEDLQWIDPSTMELIQSLAEQCATCSLMLLVTARPEFRAPWPARSHHGQLTLNRLDSRQTRALVAGVVARAGLEDQVIDAVIQRTDGVPLFAEELTRLILERSGAGAQAIPETLLDSLAARLDRMGRAKRVAQVAAVLGREFSYALIHAVAEQPERELREDLHALADAELIFARGSPPEASYRFKHALVQDAAYEALLKKRRRELHARVARTITEQFADVAEGQPEVVARHWTEAGEAALAIAAWKSAGDAAFGRRAFKEAEAAYRQALALLATMLEGPERDGRELELASALNRVLQLTRGYAAPEAVEMAARARALAEKAGTLAQLIREEVRLWRAVITAGDYPGAVALADHILDLTRGEPDNSGRLLFALNAQVQTRFYTGDLAGVEAHFGRLAAMIETPGLRQSPGNNVIPIGVASLNAWAMGRPGLANERMGSALALAQESKDPYDLAMTLHFQGLLHACERDAVKSEVVARRMLALCEENGFSYAGFLGLGALGWALGQRGAAAEGLADMRKAWVGLAASGAKVGMTFGLAQLAETESLAGAVDEALGAIDEAITSNPAERVFRSDILRRRGEIRLLAGDAGSAEADFREAVAVAGEMGAAGWELRAALSLARLLVHHGRAADARAVLDPICAGFPEPLAPDVQAAKALLESAG